MNVRRVAAPSRSPQQGYILAVVALLMIPLFAATGLAVDVGSWYVQAARIQRAADAAALAGVVWLPDVSSAQNAVDAALERNGIDPADDRYEVTVNPIGDARLRVDVLDQRAEQFFSQLVLDEVQIRRGATAEFVRPIPLGSPLNRFGNDLSCAGEPCRPGFWAAIQGPFTARHHGDPYATSCASIPATGVGTACATNNPDYRPAGYWYLVQVPQALIDRMGGVAYVNVEIYDAGFYARTSPTTQTGDSRLNGSTTSPGFQVEVFRPDNTPLDHTDNPPFPGGVCRRTVAAQAEASVYRDRWVTVCRVRVTEATRFPVNVRTSDLDGLATTGSASNHYSLRARPECGTCPDDIIPRLYAVGDMSIFFNQGEGANAEFFLAEVDESAAGKEVRVELFDPGDGFAGNYFMSIIDPRTGNPFASCSWVSTSGLSGSPSPCTIQTSDSGASRFDDHWLSVRINLPNNYQCAAGPNGCWWKVRYSFPGGARPTDRITVAVRIVGDPVRLVR